MDAFPLGGGLAQVCTVYEQFGKGVSGWERPVGKGHGGGGVPITAVSLYSLPSDLPIIYSYLFLTLSRRDSEYLLHFVGIIVGMRHRYAQGRA